MSEQSPEFPPSEELLEARAMLTARKGMVSMARRKYRSALDDLKQAERKLAWAEHSEHDRILKKKRAMKVAALHKLIADLRPCPYCTAEKGELCWNGSAYIHGKEEKSHSVHPERGDQYGPLPDSLPSRKPIQKWGFYGGWNPFGMR